MNHAVNFTASSGTSRTGLYMSLACYFSSTTSTPVTALSVFGNFSIAPDIGCYDEVHILTSSQALGNLSDSDLSHWRCSIHETFDSYPTTGLNAFQPLAIANKLKGVGSALFADGSTGIPYILVRGVIPASCGNGIWQLGFGEECDNGSLNGVGFNECSLSCKCLSHRPAGNGTCLPPSLSSITTTSTHSTEATLYTSTISASGKLSSLIGTRADPESTATSTLAAGQIPYTITIPASGTRGPQVIIGIDPASTTTSILAPGEIPYTSTIAASGTLGSIIVIGVQPTTDLSSGTISFKKSISSTTTLAVPVLVSPTPSLIPQPAGVQPLQVIGIEVLIQIEVTTTYQLVSETQGQS
jgi:hypothetical protein